MQIIQCLDISPHFITAILLWETCRTMKTPEILYTLFTSNVFLFSRDLLSWLFITVVCTRHAVVMMGKWYVNDLSAQKKKKECQWYQLLEWIDVESFIQVRVTNLSWPMFDFVLWTDLRCDFKSDHLNFCVSKMFFPNSIILCEFSLKSLCMHPKYWLQLLFCQCFLFQFSV